ncbi:hypothetical protein HEP_00004000 [Hepatocystis sp. ex Piliocolobus tephrosceles]|nr:hypothetical protein HEP_00004000 [Hepatocystis sp. ex Piliocolobus tephrosceles]
MKLFIIFYIVNILFIIDLVKSGNDFCGTMATTCVNDCVNPCYIKRLNRVPKKVKCCRTSFYTYMIPFLLGLELLWGGLYTAYYVGKRVGIECEETPKNEENVEPKQ